MSVEDLILCEGYDDRSFIAGWLAHWECVEQRNDPWGKPVRSGHFGYATPKQRFLRVLPCHGRDKLLDSLRFRMARSDTEQLGRVLVICDRDDHADDSPPDDRRITSDRVRASLAALGKVEDLGSCLWRVNDVDIALAYWWVGDADDPALPTKQTLERLVCSALRAVYPDRVEAVQSWLAERPSPPAIPGTKEHIWSHMAGWFADFGCDAFWRELWRDPRLVAALRERLECSGVWATLQVFVSAA